MSKDKLVINTEISAYFLWEYTKHDTALHLWYCSEDIAFFFENHRIFSKEHLNKIVCLPKYDLGYIEFVRHIAYRVYSFTLEQNCMKNWSVAEHILSNAEWNDAVINIAVLYNKIRCGDKETADSIRSEKIRRLFTT